MGGSCLVPDLWPQNTQEKQKKLSSQRLQWKMNQSASWVAFGARTNVFILSALPLQHFLVWHNMNKQFYAIIGCQRGFNNVIDPGRYKAKLDINHKKLTL